MDSKKILKGGLLALPLLLALAGCKPSEKSYREAYESAIAKQAKEAYDADLGLNVTGLHQANEARMRPVPPQQGRALPDSVPVKRRRLAPLEESDTVKRYNLVVATFKMPTNARSMASRLAARGWKAFTAKDSDKLYYVVAASEPTLQDAAERYQRYTSGGESLTSFIPIVIEQ